MTLDPQSVLALAKQIDEFNSLYVITGDVKDMNTMLVPLAWLRAAALAAPQPDMEGRSELVSGIKAAIRELTRGAHYPDLMEAIDQLAASPAPSAEQDRWISVHEKKPEFGVNILLWVHAENECEDDDGRPFSKDDSQVQMGQYRDDGHGPYFDCFATPFADREGVTHWQPMPSAPDMKEEKRYV